MIDIGFNPSRIKDDYLEVCTPPLLITEESKTGLARLICEFENTTGKEYFRVLKEHDPLPYMVNKKCADGILIESDTNERNKANLYILELKTGMDVSTWNHVKAQFRGSTLKALAIANAMGINQIENIVYYTAYVEADQMNQTLREVELQKRIEGTIARKQLVGVNRKTVEEWKSKTIKPFPEQPANFEHIHLHLNPEDGVNVGSVLIK